jgi:hypothetical protein
MYCRIEIKLKILLKVQKSNYHISDGRDCFKPVVHLLTVLFCSVNICFVYILALCLIQ